MSTQNLHTDAHRSTIPNKQKLETTQMSMNEWINKRWSLRTMEYDCSMKRNGAPAHATMWTPLGNMMQGERSQA